MLWWLAQNTVMAGVLAGLVVLACRVCRFRPAVRHALWLLVLLKLIAPPLLPWPWPDAEPWRGDVVAAVESVPEKASESATRPVETPASGELFAKWMALDPTVTSEPAVPESEHRFEIVPFPAGEVSPPVDVDPTAAPSPGFWQSGATARLAFNVWLVAAAAMAGLQLIRILRFRRLVGSGLPAPASLSELVAKLAMQLGVRPPETLVVQGLASPMVWGLGRPLLLWPAWLLGRMTPDCQRAVIVHELAHLRRRDHWVGWLQLAVGCAWWWNPLFRFVNKQVRRNAELACDAWVVETLPSARRAYAEALLEVSQLSSRNALPLPALGMAGGHPDFERRLIMIMRDRVPCRIPLFGAAVIGLLALIALPGWSLSQQPTQPKVKEKIKDAKPYQVTPGADVEVILQDVVIDPGKAGGDGDRLDRLEKQLEALLKEVKAMRAGTPKSDLPVKATAPKVVTVETKPNTDAKAAGYPSSEGKRVYFEVIDRGEGGGQSVTLTRATYKMPKEKAEALAKFLSDQVKGQVLETKVDGDGIVVTTTPGNQRTIHEFINLVQGKTGQSKEVWMLDGFKKSELKDAGTKPEQKEDKKPELPK
jgi:beta-lactamase regulating signal transducer with metallopeptidase domain